MLLWCHALAVLLTVLSSVVALPPWSWDTVQTYVHCANYSGEWNDEALDVLAQQPFVVFEKYHKVFEEPIIDNAETKIVESCRKVKARNPKTDCYIYVESDWARTEYSLGHWFVDHPDAALSCSAGTNDTLCNCTDKHCQEDGCKLYHRHYPAYDFNNSLAREKWIERVTNVTSTGFVDGAFIDGDRGGWSSSVLGKCPAEKKASWAVGLGEAVETLARRLGPNKTLISNYPTSEAMEFCVGGMMERGGSSKDIESFGKKTCGLFNQTCLLDYHAQYFSSPRDGKLAGFLLGVQKYGYFGGGSGWGGPGPDACKLWLTRFPEFSKKLGEPLGDMQVAKAPWPGAVCEADAGKRGNTTGCLYTRTFASGTKVFVGSYLQPEKRNDGGHCIYWSDGSVTTDNATRCQPKSEF